MNEFFKIVFKKGRMVFEKLSYNEIYIDKETLNKRIEEFKKGYSLPEILEREEYNQPQQHKEKE